MHATTIRLRQPLFRLLAAATVAAALAASAAPARADYPVSGTWSYDLTPAAGAACGKRFMNFQGLQRADTGGGVPAYRNVSVTGSAPNWRVVDEFFTVQQRGRVSFTLRALDKDHIELMLERGGRIALRRCNS